MAKNFSEGGYVVIVEGESDAQTLWLHGYAALGLPGAGNWNEQRDASLLADVRTIFILVEPDLGGRAVMKWLRRSSITPRVRLVRLAGAKDPSELYLADPEAFPSAFQRSLDEAEPYQASADREVEGNRARTRQDAGDLVPKPDILGR